MSAFPFPSIEMRYVLLREGLVESGSVYYGEVYFADGSVLRLDLHQSLENAARQTQAVASEGACHVRLCLLPGRLPS